MGSGEGGGPLPAGDAADALEIGHDIVAGARFESARHGRALGKILSELQRGFELARQRGIAGMVVMPDRLLQPIDGFPIERAPTLARLGEAERLIVVDHDGDRGADALLHRMEGGKVLGQSRIAEPELDGAKAAGAQPFRLVGHLVRRCHQPQSTGIVGPDPLRRAAKEPGKGKAGGLGQGVPRRHVEARHGHAHDPLHSDQGETLGKPAPEIDRRDAFPSLCARPPVGCWRSPASPPGNSTTDRNTR